jgi:hypothetical protein
LAERCGWPALRARPESHCPLNPQAGSEIGQ